MIDRNRLEDSFAKYTAQFDVSDERISLKIRHTRFVAENSDYIAEQLGLRSQQKNIAWAVAMLHDIGRFEQAARTGSFLDTAAYDHAAEGTAFLFDEGNITAFLDEEDDCTLGLIRTAIDFHNKHSLPETLSAEERLFCSIIRDADKLDIFRVFSENSFATVHEYTEQEVQVSPVSQVILDCFDRHETVDYSKRVTPADLYLSHFAMAFGLEFPCSRKRLLEQGYVRSFFCFRFTNPETQKAFEGMKAQIDEYLAAVEEG